MQTRRQFVKTMPILGTGLLLAETTVPGALALAPVPPFAEAPKARNVILMISDGCGFNGWLAADYYQGRAGTQPYQVARPDGTRPYVGASAHDALRMFGPDGTVLDNDQWDAARGVEEQGYRPRDRWTRLEGAFMPRFIEEQMDFNAAVAAVIGWVETHSNWDDTLLIVTSDHETGGIWGEGTYETESGILHSTNPLDADSRAATQFVPGRDRFDKFRVVQDRGARQIPGHQFASGEHTNDLVPLWALGAGSTLFRQFERHDAFARTLWGEPYGWAGNYVDNTAVFHVMNTVFANEHRARKAAPSRAAE